MDPELDAPAAPAPDLRDLMIRYQHGEAAAAKALVEVLSVPLYRYFASQGETADAAEDSSQETWLRIHRVRHTYRPSEPLLPWVYAIARRVRIDRYRRRSRIGRREIATTALPEAAAAAQGERALPSFAELVAPLPENQREALTLLKVNGLSIEEVARATASTSGSVKQRVHRAYDRLRKLLDESGARRGARS